MPKLEDLQKEKESLEWLRYAGIRSVQSGDGRKVEYRTDQELRAAWVDLNRQIQAASNPAPISMIRVSSSKGI